MSSVKRQIYQKIKTLKNNILAKKMKKMSMSKKNLRVSFEKPPFQNSVFNSPIKGSPLYNPRKVSPFQNSLFNSPIKGSPLYNPIRYSRKASNLNKNLNKLFEMKKKWNIPRPIKKGRLPVPASKTRVKGKYNFRVINKKFIP
jgi:hypothetical protein